MVLKAAIFKPLCRFSIRFYLDAAFPVKKINPFCHTLQQARLLFSYPEIKTPIHVPAKIVIFIACP
jgi:hypothetical protein